MSSNPTPGSEQDDDDPSGDDTEPAPAPDESDAELFRRYRRSGSRRIRNELVERNMGLAAHIAARFQRSGGGDDVRQVAMLGLVKAVDRFDPDHGATFGSFAGLTIEGEIKRHFRDGSWTVRVPRSAKELHLLVRNASERLSHDLSRSPTVDELADELQLERDQVLRGLSAGAALHVGSIDALGTTDAGVAPGDRSMHLGEDDAGFTESEQRDLVADLLHHLPPREREIVRLRFFEERSQSEIAELVGISQMHVSRLLRRSFELMRVRLDHDD